MDVLPFPRAIAFVACVQDNCRLKFTFIRMWKDGAFACVVVQDPPAGDGGSTQASIVLLTYWSTKSYLSIWSYLLF